MTRYMKREGKVWIRIFPDKPITKKPLETRMGKGKGNPEEWVAVVRPGRILYELEGVDPSVAKEAMRASRQTNAVVLQPMPKPRLRDPATGLHLMGERNQVGNEVGVKLGSEPRRHCAEQHSPDPRCRVARQQTVP